MNDKSNKKRKATNPIVEENNQKGGEIKKAKKLNNGNAQKFEVKPEEKTFDKNKEKNQKSLAKKHKENQPKIQNQGENQQISAEKKQFSGKKKPISDQNKEKQSFSGPRKNFPAQKEGFSGQKKEFSGAKNEFSHQKQPFSGQKQEFKGGKNNFSSNKKQFSKQDNKEQQKQQFSKEKENKKDDAKPDNEEDLEYNEDGKNLILITKMNKLATKLFDKQIKDNSEKIKIIENILNKLGVLLPKLINKRSASKFIQACYKFGNQEQRNRIFDSLKNTELSEIFKSKYGHFLLVKIAKKGTKLQKNKLFEEILKNAWFFVSHKEAGQVIDSYIRNAATPQQLNKIKAIFKVDPTQNTERIENVAMRIIEKDISNYQLSQFILTKVFKILIPNEREKVLEKFKDNLIDLAKTKEGISLALEIINYSNNKQKKTILKTLKGKVLESIQDHDKKFLIILKLLSSVDDREVLNKYVLKEITSNLEAILKTQNGINVISSILIPKHNLLNTLEEQENLTTTCKKDETIRREEIISIILPTLVNYLEGNLSESLKDRSLSRVVSTLLQKILSDEDSFEKYKPFVEKTWECFEKEMTEGLNTNDPEEINKKFLIAHPDANRVLKNIIRLSNETKSEESKSFLENKIEIIYEFLAKNLTLHLKTRLIFLIIALIENTSYKEALIQNINKIKNKIPENVQGLNILKSII